MEIRKIDCLESILEVEKIAKIIWEEHFTPIIGKEQVSYMLDKFLSKDVIATSIDKDGYMFYGMYENDALIGFTSVHPEEELLFLSKLYILKEKRGNAFARTTLAFLETIAKAKGLKGIWLTCNKYNHTTLAIYKHMGFEIFDEAVNDIGNGYVMDDYYLRKYIF